MRIGLAVALSGRAGKMPGEPRCSISAGATPLANVVDGKFLDNARAGRCTVPLDGGRWVVVGGPASSASSRPSRGADRADSHGDVAHKLGRWLTPLAVAAVGMALSACFATKYEMVGKDSPPPALLHLAASDPPVDLGLRAAIVYDGPGSWKREALWDEYVVTIHNRGDSAVTLTGAALVDFAGSDRGPGDDPWHLEKESQTLEQQYQRAGVAFARGSIPRALIAGASVATEASGGIIAGGVATVAAVSVVALPVYYVVVWKVNHRNKKAVNEEFARRRIALPVTLAAGELRTGSLFFPMVPSPRSLKLEWSNGTAVRAVVLSLQTLNGLHTVAPAPKESGAQLFEDFELDRQTSRSIRGDP